VWFGKAGLLFGLGRSQLDFGGPKMPRSELAGGTDYRHQTFEDMVSDMRKWVNSLEEIIRVMNELVEKLKDVEYWDGVDYDFRALVAYSMTFYKTSLSEISEMLVQFTREVKNGHVVRIKKLGKLAGEINRDFGLAWNRDYGRKEYGKEEFKLVEKIYEEGRGMAIDMLDLSNVAERLEDFVGTKGEAANEGKRKFSWLIMKPNFYGIGVDLRKLKLSSLLNSMRKKWMKKNEG